MTDRYSRGISHVIDECWKESAYNIQCCASTPAFNFCCSKLFTGHKHKALAITTVSRTASRSERKSLSPSRRQLSNPLQHIAPRLLHYYCSAKALGSMTKASINLLNQLRLCYMNTTQIVERAAALFQRR